MDGTAYAEALLGTLPQGLAWRRDRASNLWKLLHGCGEEFARVDARAADLRREANPLLADELLPEWEALVGLPDECSPPASTLSERRAAVVEKLAFIGDQSPAAYVALALRFGLAVTVFEPRPMQCGDLVGSLLYGEPWHHTFYVRAPATTVTELRVGDRLEAPFRAFGHPQLECAVNDKKPAHSKAFVTYGS
jgi:uncharacterized protein YmfQ (DUF2313 family)